MTDSKQSISENYDPDSIHHFLSNGIFIQIYGNGKNGIISFRAELKGFRRFLLVTVDNSAKIEKVENYIKNNIKTITFAFKVIKAKKELEKEWSEEYSNDMNDCHLWFDSIQAILNYRLFYKEIEEEKGEAPIEEEIMWKAYYDRGSSVNHSFVCSLCGNGHSIGSSYVIRGHRVFVCSYCKGDIRDTKPSTKVILTNMGHSKKS